MSAAVRLALAVTLVWLRPLHTARRIRSQESAMLWLADRAVTAYRQNEALRGMPAPSAERHLHLVK